MPTNSSGNVYVNDDDDDDDDNIIWDPLDVLFIGARVLPSNGSGGDDLS